MSKNSLLKELTIILGLTLLGAAAILAGIKTDNAIIEVQLATSGETIAVRWSDHFKRQSKDLPQIFGKRRIHEDTKQAFQMMGELSSIFRYELFDEYGNLFHASASADLGDITAAVDSPFLGPTAHDALEGPTTQVIEQDPNTWPTRYAVVTIPMRAGRTFLGSVRAFVDLTQEAAQMSRALGLIAAVTGALIIVAIGVPTLIIGLKILQQWKAEAQIRYLSQHDKLSGLLNREAFCEHLSERLETHDEDAGHIAFICLDVDRYSEFIESLGHASGDGLLKALAWRLQRLAGKNMLMGRMDGGEFAIALDAHDGDEVGLFVKKLQDGLTQPYLVNGMDLTCTISFGIAIAPDDGKDCMTLMRKGEVAVRKAFSEGLNLIRFFEPEMDNAHLERRQHEKELRESLIQNQFDMHYQPKVDMRNGRTYGHEALIRWNHPIHGAVSPAYFIPIAEETGFIIPLGEWIMRRACADAVKWPEPRNVAVNISPVQFERISIFELVSQVLEETGLPVENLEIEITENLLMTDADDVLSEFSKLRDIGVGIAMDDFGTGYSSLSYISRFPLTTIKLDRCFVNRLERDQNVQAIVRCIIDLGRALDIDIVAEGVEAPAQASLLRELGCSYAQGYLFGRPSPASDCAKRLKRATELTDSGLQETAVVVSQPAPA